MKKKSTTSNTESLRDIWSPKMVSMSIDKSDKVPDETVAVGQSKPKASTLKGTNVYNGPPSLIDFMW